MPPPNIGPALLLIAASAVAQSAQLPQPGATEQWTPVPPVVTAAPDRPPSDALVLFAGGNLDAWVKPSWRIEEGALVVVPGSGNLRTKAAFGDVQLHLEFREPLPARGAGQDRGNSGVFLMGLYEVQILDSYDNATYVNGQAASVYKQYPPLVNANRPPGAWQAYDIVFHAPRFALSGRIVPARLTVLHNGVLVQDNVALRGPTAYRGRPPYHRHADRLPLELQDHGSPVAFRNIWIRDLTPAAADRVQPPRAPPSPPAR